MVVEPTNHALIVAHQNMHCQPSNRRLSIQPRGLRRDDAAAYVGVSPSKFDDWVDQGIMPEAKREGGIVVWDRLKLDDAFDTLDDGREAAELEVWNDLEV